MLTFIGVGPGDPELMTLKAVRLIQKADAIALPDKGAALRIVGDLIEGKPLLELNLPMRGSRSDWESAHDHAATQLLNWLERYENVAFPVLGDPGIYATGSYLLRRVRPHHPCVVVPGVPAMCAAAAALGMPLCEKGESLTVLDHLGEGDRLPQGNCVVMKATNSLDSLRREAAGREVRVVRNLGMDGEWLGALANVPTDRGSYFTTAIVPAVKASEARRAGGNGPDSES